MTTPAPQRASVLRHLPSCTGTTERIFHKHDLKSRLVSEREGYPRLLVLESWTMPRPSTDRASRTGQGSSDSWTVDDRCTTRAHICDRLRPISAAERASSGSYCEQKQSMFIASVRSRHRPRVGWPEREARWSGFATSQIDAKKSQSGWTVIEQHSILHPTAEQSDSIFAIFDHGKLRTQPDLQNETTKN